MGTHALDPYTMSGRSNKLTNHPPIHPPNRMQTAAYAQDPGDAVALNSLATYYLHKWFRLPARAPAHGLVEGQARVSVEMDGSGRYGKSVCLCMYVCMYVCICARWWCR